MKKTIIISNRLPIRISEKDGEWVTTPSEGGLATGLSSIFHSENNLWIGWPGIETSDPESQQNITHKLSALNLIPVFLTQEEISLYYEGFSNEVLWPICHYLATYAKYDQMCWECYKKVNTKFKEAVLSIAQPGDTIWIHDYQLLLLACMIREEQPDMLIGFFLHIPFPSYELFRLIPWRAELLGGMLGADLIGFHTFDDARHFISAVSRILPVHSSANIITHNHRQTIVEAFPMGIDYERFESMVHEPLVQEHIVSLKKIFEKQKVILFIYRLDYSKGILQRLQAIDLLFQLHPDYIERISFYMIVVPSRDQVSQYRELKDEIDKLAGNINAHYRTIDWHPINYFYRPFRMEAISALYCISDVCLVTPMRDGMNLVCKEYIASKTNNEGVLVLSEMAGASKELIDAIIVNPNNIEEMMQAIIEALNMSASEQERRMLAMRQMVKRFNVKHWVRNFLCKLNEVRQLQESMLAKHVGASTQLYLEKAYKESSKRLIILDYDGTLIGFHKSIELAAPDEDLYQLLYWLSADPANQLLLISGRKHDNLEEWFGHIPMDLIAEHGAWTRKYGGPWTILHALTNDWKQDILPVLETFTDRTPGSFIEDKSYSLVWHHRKVDPAFGELRANELINNLRYYASDRGLQIMPGNKVIEIKNVEVNKGKAVALWLYDKEYDFILALGDDYTDEDIFKTLPNEAITIKIGSNLSAARFYLRDHIEARKLLENVSDYRFMRDLKN